MADDISFCYKFCVTPMLHGELVINGTESVTIDLMAIRNSELCAALIAFFSPYVYVASKDYLIDLGQ